MRLTWIEETEAAALNRQEWHRVQCGPLHQSQWMQLNESSAQVNVLQEAFVDYRKRRPRSPYLTTFLSAVKAVASRHHRSDSCDW